MYKRLVQGGRSYRYRLSESPDTNSQLCVFGALTAIYYRRALLPFVVCRRVTRLKLRATLVPTHKTSEIFARPT